MISTIKQVRDNVHWVAHQTVWEQPVLFGTVAREIANPIFRRIDETVLQGLIRGFTSDSLGFALNRFGDPADPFLKLYSRCGHNEIVPNVV